MLTGSASSNQLPVFVKLRRFGTPQTVQFHHWLLGGAPLLPHMHTRRHELCFLSNQVKMEGQ